MIPGLDLRRFFRACQILEAQIHVDGMRNGRYNGTNQHLIGGKRLFRRIFISWNGEYLIQCTEKLSTEAFIKTHDIGKITIGSGLTQQKYIDQYKRNGNKWSQKENYIAVKDTVRGFENSLRGILPEYDQYPAEMRKALIDIIYNIGEGGLKNSPKFLSAMKSRNWNEAKRQMDWDNSDPLFGNGARKRNAERAALFDAGLAHWSPANQIEQMMESVPQFVPPIIKTPDPIQTDYSIRTLTNNSIPATINSRNNGDSPLYGGSDYSFRMPSLKEYIERNLMRPQW